MSQAIFSLLSDRCADSGRMGDREVGVHARGWDVEEVTLCMSPLEYDWPFRMDGCDHWTGAYLSSLKGHNHAGTQGRKEPRQYEWAERNKDLATYAHLTLPSG